MRSKLSKIAIIFCLFGAMLQCDNYEFPKSPYHHIQTLPVVNISEKGITLQGTVTHMGEKPIIDHGFVWGLDDNLSFEYDDYIRLGTLTGAGLFETEMKYGLYPDKIYYVRAFVATESYYTYGDVVSFTSQ